VRVGWTIRVAARARCWGGGRRAGVREEAPHVRRGMRRLSACVSTQVINWIAQLRIKALTQAFFKVDDAVFTELER